MAKGKKVVIKEGADKLPVIKPTIIQEASSSDLKTQFRIYVGSYEHNLLCLSLMLQKEKTPVFQSIFHFQAHSLSIKAIASAKRYLVTGSNDEHIRIYDLQKRKELGTLMGHQGSITCLKFSTEGNGEDGDVERTAGKWLLSGSEDGKLIIWRTKDWEMFGTLKGHQGRVNDLAIHPSGRIAVSVGDDKTVRLWNLMTAKKAANLRVKKDWQKGEKVRWSLKGDYFFVGLLNQMLIYKTSDAKVVGEVAFKQTLMNLEVYDINGTEYAVVGLGNGALQFYKVKDLVEDEKTEPEFTLQGHTNRVKDFKLHKHNDETYLISISSDGSIVVWDMTLKDQVAVYNTGERLNCLEVTAETVEKADTMKRRYNDIDDAEASASESEAEDTEELKRIMLNDRKKKKKKSKKGGKKEKISVELE
ncbi:CYFA0S12e00716g1_1 [Cyberlindnera fabianii]|uniref:CYFA0S12e00716g1_1 n=1 Tax=Cyberlindnera fabianii TaxID=36022 RepID=A0A061B6I7_CYBFA|nr:Protein MAK11 [Cyberlindnera fabianii]CDR43459.1 CYFA0S12e00716g1_1 [Cyberlindnera fabianii]